MRGQRGFFDLDERPDGLYAALKRGAPGSRPRNDKPGSGGKNPLFFKVSDYVQ